MTLPRGIRNNNPGNIRVSQDKWEGLSAVQTDAAFFMFEAPEYGIRAAARILQTYAEKHGLRTLEQIVNRWAPPSDGNDTASYLTAVTIWADIEPDAQIDVRDFGTVSAILKAMAKIENGKPKDGADWYDNDTWERGLRMAGVTPSKSLKKSRTVQGAAIGAAGGVAVIAANIGSGLSLPPDATQALQPLLALLPDNILQIVGIVAVMIGPIRTVLARMDDQKNGRL